MTVEEWIKQTHREGEQRVLSDDRDDFLIRIEHDGWNEYLCDREDIDAAMDASPPAAG